MRMIKNIGVIVAILGLLTAIIALITEGIKFYRELPTPTPLTTQEITSISPFVENTKESQSGTASNWIELGNAVPNTGTELKWELSSGQVLVLSGWQFRIGEKTCNNTGTRQICIALFEATTSQTVVADWLLSQSNYFGITSTLSQDFILFDLEPNLWKAPNCGGGGCEGATILFFKDGAFVKEVTHTAP